MSDLPPKSSLKPEASELVLCPDEEIVGETYIFSPAPQEERLGWLFAVGEIEKRGGIGEELLDMVVQAVQREYYRDRNRSVIASFEAALHQANLVLHDAAEQGVRDWMGYFHVVLGVLAKDNLHLTTAGEAEAYLIRQSKITKLTTDLSYSPVTNPLDTFSQVASGAVAPRDTILFGTSAFSKIFRSEDLIRFGIEHSASTFRERLEQLYADQNSSSSIAAIITSLLPEHVAAKQVPVTSPPPTTPSRELPRQLTPRQPLVVHRTTLQATLALLPRLLKAGWRWFIRAVLPSVSRSSKAGGKQVAKAASKGWSSLRSRSSTIVKERQPFNRRLLLAYPLAFWRRLRLGFSNLPKTSKVFAFISLILALVLVVSLVVLRSQRAQDIEIQQASEKLHEARTKVAAAENSLIYDDRIEARNFINEANVILTNLISRDLYLEEARQLQTTTAGINDRLQRVVRSSADEIKIVGDFSEVMGRAEPDHLELIEQTLYTFNPSTNAVFSLNTQSGEAATVTDQTAEVGFFNETVVHPADKTIIILTDAPGIALFDSKENTVNDQAITFSSSEPVIRDLAVFGSRLYLYDQAASNIFNYNKSLRGFEGGGAWLEDNNFSRDSIVSLAVDGSIYTLHEDGSIKNLFKGAEVDDFSLEPVEPPLQNATDIITREDLNNLYVFDPENKRAVVYSKTGELIHQVLLDVATNLRTIAINADETSLYALDGTRVLEIPLP